MADQIKAGDVVELKSGGPKMTVESIQTSKYLCQYFFEGNLKWVEVYPHSLKLPSGNPDS